MDDVYVSSSFRDSSLFKSYEIDKSTPYDAQKKRVLKSIRSGVAIDRSELPDEYFYKYRGGVPEKLTHFCLAGFSWVISEQVAEIFSSFNLGNNHIKASKFFDHEKTLLPFNHSAIAFGEQKNALDVENSSRIFLVWPDNPIPPDVWELHHKPDDGDMTVTQAALEGPDIWCDPRVFNHFFMSGRLVEALKAAKLNKDFRLTKCNISS